MEIRVELYNKMKYIKYIIIKLCVLLIVNKRTWNYPRSLALKKI